MRGRANESRRHRGANHDHTAAQLMTENLGETRSGEPITEELLEKLTAQADFDVEEILRRREGRPPLG
ncbi:MAG: hypothetical protein QOG43_2183 [Actinomycetota bacterium]|nr:hypothetical protein [Actinomycetota bacterium]